MADLFAGLSSLGLGKLEGMDIFAEPDKKAQAQEQDAPAQVTLEEKDFLFDKSYECPVCYKKITAKTVRAGKCRLVQTDMDLRPVYDALDVTKYDVILCPRCGYAALTRYNKPLPSVQAKLIRENISQNFKMDVKEQEIYTYEDALQRYQMALANAVVKRAKASEKAYICLKSAWVLRGWKETLTDSAEDTAKGAELGSQEQAYLKNAYEGFLSAIQEERFPMCGMDEDTMNYLLAVLAIQFKKFDIASKLIGKILTSSTANSRIKDRTRDLKDIVIEEIKKNK